MNTCLLRNNHMHPSLGTVTVLPQMCPGVFSNMLHWLIVGRNPQAPPRHHQKNTPTKTTAGQMSSSTSCTTLPLRCRFVKLSLPIAMQLFCGVDSFFSPLRDAFWSFPQHAPPTRSPSSDGLYVCGSVITGCFDRVLSSSSLPSTIPTLPS